MTTANAKLTAISLVGTGMPIPPAAGGAAPAPVATLSFTVTDAITGGQYGFSQAVPLAEAQNYKIGQDFTLSLVPN
jgi:hypothetical protein